MKPESPNSPASPFSTKPIKNWWTSLWEKLKPKEKTYACHDNRAFLSAVSHLRRWTPDLERTGGYRTRNKGNFSILPIHPEHTEDQRALNALYQHVFKLMKEEKDV